MAVEDTVHDLLAGVVSAAGVELIDVEYAGGSLRVTVDTDGGVTTEQLAEVNRLVSPILDQHDPIPGRYLLEVSSPGLERPLRTPTHYARAVGEQVVVKRTADHEPRRVRGDLLAAADGRLTIRAVETDGVELVEPAEHIIDLDTVASGRTVFDWGPAPKPGGPKPGKGQAAGKSSGAKGSSGGKKASGGKAGGGSSGGKKKKSSNPRGAQ
ncbi:MAG: ribosome maturation factor RimP [Actinomycetota bacterium]